MRLYQYSESNYSSFPITLPQLPCRTIMIWWTSSHISLPRCFCVIVWPKKVGSFLGKCQRWSPILIKLQDNVSKTELQHWLSPRIFPNLEQPFCRAHVSISSWALDAFLAFNRDTLLCSLLELLTHKSTKEQFRNVP